MTQMTASTPSRNIDIWAARAREAGTWLAIAAVAFALGMFVFAPMQARSQSTYMPPSHAALPTGVISLQGEEGPALLLPVRIADTSQARLTALRDVGEDVLANQFVLYGQTRQTTTRISYNLEKVRVPLEMAVIDGEGNVVSIVDSPAGQERLSVTVPHRWLLAAKSGTFAHYGIAEGLKLDTESIRKINL